MRDSERALPRDAAADFPREALALLPVLHREAGRELDLWRLLASSPPICVALMLEGAVALGWSAASTTLGAGFVWAIALLAGIAAITHNHIRGFARHPRPVPLTETVRELRLLLFLTGLAWGLGAVLVLPAAPVWAALVFAAAPSLTVALILRDEKGTIAFAGPTSLLSASALFQDGQPQAIGAAAIIVIAGVSIAGLSMLQCAMRSRQDLH